MCPLVPSHVVFTSRVAHMCSCLHACLAQSCPRDGQTPSDCASGSDAFPPKSSAAARSGIDEAMGPWLCPQEGDVLLLAHLTVHMDSECVLITRRTYPLRMCYCVTKLHRCFHYEVDSDLVFFFFFFLSRTPLAQAATLVQARLC